MRVPVYKGMPRSVISYYNWTGFYLGVHVGYGFGGVIGLERRHRQSGERRARRDGLTAARLGYNWQTGSWVYGLEGDFSLLRRQGIGRLPGAG